MAAFRREWAGPSWSAALLSLSKLSTVLTYVCKSDQRWISCCGVDSARFGWLSSCLYFKMSPCQHPWQLGLRQILHWKNFGWQAAVCFFCSPLLSLSNALRAKWPPVPLSHRGLNSTRVAYPASFRYSLQYKRPTRLTLKPGRQYYVLYSTFNLSAKHPHLIVCGSLAEKFKGTI